jgi:hypothetical protein
MIFLDLIQRGSKGNNLFYKEVPRFMFSFTDKPLVHRKVPGSFEIRAMWPLWAGGGVARQNPARLAAAPAGERAEKAKGLT